MSFNLTTRAKTATALGVIEPQLVLDVDRYTDLFTTAEIAEVARYGAGNIFFGDAGLVFGGISSIVDQESFISLDGTTNQITQQLFQDESGTSSTSNLTISLVNKDNALSMLATPSVTDDILSKKASVWLGSKGTAYPEDFIRIFVGNVSQIKTSAGLVNLTISHPENLKRAQLFTKVQTELVFDITDETINIPVTTHEGMLTKNADGYFKCYVRIDDEIIEYLSLGYEPPAPPTLYGCTRGALGTIATSHDAGASVDTFYVLGDGTTDTNAIYLALMVLISGSDQPWIVDVAASTFALSDDLISQNSIFFQGQDLVTDYNLTVGDTVTVTAASETDNNVINAEVSAIYIEDTGTRVVLTGVILVPESSSPAVCSFTSQWAVLPDGVGLTPDQVDIAEFERVYELFNSTIPNLVIYLKDTITGTDLVNQEILFPSACYSLPRKGRVSLGKTKPPIAEFETKVINEDTVLNASDLTMERSTQENFYNAVVYRYEEDTLEDQFLAGKITVSNTSANRIKKIGNKPLTVTSKGLRKNSDTETILENNAVRILDRFQFGAEVIGNVQVPFSVGWNMEVGDTCIVKDLQLFDSKTGERGLAPRIMEVTNRAFNFKLGTIKLELTDTSYAVDGRYGVVSPSSQVAAGSSATRLLLKKSYGTQTSQLEQEKWTQYIGLTVLVHSEDWLVVGTATLLGFDSSNDSAMLISSDLAFTPLEDYIIDIAGYEDAEDLFKAVHCYFNPQVLITADSIDQKIIEVNDSSLFFIGAIIKVHTTDYSEYSQEAIVTDITGDSITVDRNLFLDYFALIDDEVDLIGFVDDEGNPYRIL